MAPVNKVVSSIKIYFIIYLIDLISRWKVFRQTWLKEIVFL